MLKRFISIISATFVGAFLPIVTVGAERHFDFSEFPLNQTPSNFVSMVSGQGKPGDWKVIETEVPPVLAPLSPGAQKTSKRTVVAQLAEDPTDEHFPLLAFDGENFGDFTVSTRFKIVRGTAEQMAGIAFRIKDERNYYVVRVSALGNNIRFYKFVAGQRSQPIGSDVPISTNAWHELKVQCKGNQIRSWLDGKDWIPPLTDTSLASGRIGFWTKSDSVAYFVDTRIDYVPLIPFAQTLVKDTVKKYPRLLGVKIFARKNSDKPTVVASADETEIGTAGGEVETAVLSKAAVYYTKKEKAVEITLPLRDRNGDVAGALRTSMKPFAGETKETALARAMIIKKFMEERLAGATGLLE